MNYQKLLETQRNYFVTDVTKTYAFRRKALLKLKSALKLHEEEIYKALKLDLAKSAEETYVTELGLIYQEINFQLRHLKRNMKIKRVKTPLALFPAKSYVYQEPYGSVLIIAPWNYPLLLAFNPLVGAIAAGNTAIIKPSELAPNTASITEKIIKATFKEAFIATVLGGIPETTSLLKNKFDYIFFTGSPRVGKIIMETASKTLTPLTLELGGKSPVVITEDANLGLAAKRIAYGKTINAGQTCIAPDYLLIHESLVSDFVIEFKKAITMFYNDALKNESYPKIITPNHFARLISLIKDENVILGGKNADQKLEPTLVLIKDKSTLLMQEEIFGPILPVVPYKTLDEALSYIKQNEKPLAAYLFTESKRIKKQFTAEISAGGIVLNDTLMHFANTYLPFGGVGNSGFGKYHGQASFRTFSHAKAVVDRKTYLDVKLRYHPLTKKKLKYIKKVIK